MLSHVPGQKCQVYGSRAERITQMTEHHYFGRQRSKPQLITPGEAGRERIVYGQWQSPPSCTLAVLVRSRFLLFPLKRHGLETAGTNESVNVPCCHRQVGGQLGLPDRHCISGSTVSMTIRISINLVSLPGIPSAAAVSRTIQINIKVHEVCSHIQQ